MLTEDAVWSIVLAAMGVLLITVLLLCLWLSRMVIRHGVCDTIIYGSTSATSVDAGVELQERGVHRGRLVLPRQFHRLDPAIYGSTSTTLPDVSTLPLPDVGKDIEDDQNTQEEGGTPPTKLQRQKKLSSRDDKISAI